MLRLLLQLRRTVALERRVGEEGGREQEEEEEQVEMHVPLSIDRGKVMTPATDGMMVPLSVEFARNMERILAGTGAVSATSVRVNSSINRYHGNKHGRKSTWQGASEACGQPTSRWRSAERRWKASTTKEVGLLFIADQFRSYK